MNQRDSILPCTAAPAKAYRPHYRFCRWDALIVLAVVLLAGGIALGLFYSAQNSLSASSHLEAVLTVNGDEVWRVNLSEITASQDYIMSGATEKMDRSGRAWKSPCAVFDMSGSGMRAYRLALRGRADRGLPPIPGGSQGGCR